MNFLRILDIRLPADALYILHESAKDSQATLDFSRIRHLEIGTPYFNESMAMLWEDFLKSCCQNVEEYCVCPSTVVRPSFILEGRPPFNPLIFSFPLLPKMRRLIVKSWFKSLLGPRHNPVPHLLKALDDLSGLKSSEVLKTVDSEIHFPPKDVTEMLAEVSRCPDIWGGLDEILGRRHAFSGLTTVTLLMKDRNCTYTQSDEELDELKGVIHSYMANLEGKKVDVRVSIQSSRIRN